MHNREGLTLWNIWTVFKDWRQWPIYILGLTFLSTSSRLGSETLCSLHHFSVPVNPPQTYLTLSLRALGFNTTEANLLSIPSIALGIITLLIFCYFSEYVDSRVGAMLTLQFWALPLLIVLYTFTKETSNWVVFAVVTLITGFPYVHPVQVAWASTNSYSVGGRTVSASIYNMFVQAGGIVSVSAIHSNLGLFGLTIDGLLRSRIFIAMMTSPFVRCLISSISMAADGLT